MSRLADLRDRCKRALRAALHAAYGRVAEALVPFWVRHLLTFATFLTLLRVTLNMPGLDYPVGLLAGGLAVLFHVIPLVHQCRDDVIEAGQLADRARELLNAPVVLTITDQGNAYACEVRVCDKMDPVEVAGMIHETARGLVSTERQRTSPFN